ncbi:MAG: peptidoglycan bridge formation glycyltransferase FemA/FemB family protein [Bacteroidales bacterium]|nr:peptidoglycan bridge formation glycyltransferase FemA/FemB family protein [Bacteroidales bacterium]
MKLLTDLSSIDRSQWQMLVNQSPVASIFQTPEMCDFYSTLNLYKVKVIAVEENQILKGVVLCLLQQDGGPIKRHLTSRAIINGGPLLADDISDEALHTLLNATIQMLKKQCIYTETRNLNDYSRWRNIFEASGFSYVPHYNFHIDTTDINQVDKRIDKSRRRRIRRAIENGATISNESLLLPAFYQILSDLYHNKIHKPLPPYCMFEQLAHAPFAHYFFVLNQQKEVIGGQLILMLYQQVAYAWYCCGLDKEYHDLYPSIMANYAAIRYAADNGFERYDMMGAGTPKEDYGVRDFKAQFGGTLVEHGRYLHVCRPAIYWMGSKVIALLKYLHK